MYLQKYYINKNADYMREEAKMTYEELLENARPEMGKYCKACPVCNGKACGNQMPGPGAKGVGDTAIRNYENGRISVLIWIHSAQIRR